MPLSINPDTVCFVIAKAREVNVKVAPEEMADDGDDMERILEDDAYDATYQELKAFLHAQSDDIIRELLALTWIGRGDYTADDWRGVMGEIKDVREQHTSEYLLGAPLLADYLEEGLSQFCLSVTTSAERGRNTAAIPALLDPDQCSPGPVCHALKSDLGKREIRHGDPGSAHPAP